MISKVCYSSNITNPHHISCRSNWNPGFLTIFLKCPYCIKVSFSFKVIVKFFTSYTKKLLSFPESLIIGLSKLLMVILLKEAPSVRNLAKKDKNHQKITFERSSWLHLGAHPENFSLHTKKSFCAFLKAG